MGAYVEPDRWNKASKEADQDGKDARSRIKAREGRSWGGKSAAMGGSPFLESNSDRKAGAASYDSAQNRDESMAEDADQRTVDQYPKGTKIGANTSRNKNGYGKTPAFANGGVIGSSSPAGRKSYKK